MNYFGLFFSFTLPGILLGIMITLAALRGLAKKRREEKK